MVTDRIEAAIERLTSISSDLKSIIAVHEQRISNQEKIYDELHDTVEKRRTEVDIKLKDVYTTMREQDNSVLQEIAKLREESSDSHKALTININKKLDDVEKKINQMEKYIWVALGGAIVISWILSQLVHNFAIFFKI